MSSKQVASAAALVAGILLLGYVGTRAGRGTPVGGAGSSSALPGESGEPSRPAPPTFGFIAGKVIDQAGEPISEAHVSVYPVSSQALDDSWREAHTSSAYSASDGTFQIGGLPTGRLFVATFAPGFCGAGKARQHCETGDHRVTLELAPCAILSGRVFGRDGYPMPGAAVRIASIDIAPGSPITRGGFETETVCDADGRYAFESVPPGKIEVQATGRSDDTSSLTIQLSEGEQFTDADISF